MSGAPELDELTLDDGERALLDDAPSPRFLDAMRRSLRGRHARRQRMLGWFDLEAPIGVLRVVHDGVLVHLVTNEPRSFDAFADAQLGFEPAQRDDDSVKAAVRAVLAGAQRGDQVVYLDELPAFQRSVLKATARIPRGEVRPYGWVAREAGSPGAVRAAGTALGHNPVPFVVPCHRVVRSDWELGQYSAAGGTQTKATVLRWEGCDLARLEELRASRSPFVASRSEGYFCLGVCHSAPDLPSDRIAFRRAEDAVAAGFEPCDECRPVAVP